MDEKTYAETVSLFFYPGYCFAFKSHCFDLALRSFASYTTILASVYQTTTFIRALPLLVAYITDDNIVLTLTTSKYRRHALNDRWNQVLSAGDQSFICIISSDLVYIILIICLQLLVTIQAPQVFPRCTEDHLRLRL
jgi:hypothetical protein